MKLKESAGQILKRILQVPGDMIREFLEWLEHLETGMVRWVMRVTANGMSYQRRIQLRWKLRHAHHRRVRRRQALLKTLNAQYALSGALVYWFIALVIGVPMLVSTIYTPGYLVQADGGTVGVVKSREEFSGLMDEVERTAGTILGTDYTLDVNVKYTRALVSRDNFTPRQAMKNYLMDQIGEVMKRYLLTVDGTVIGASEKMETLNMLLDEVKATYVTENTTSSGFVQNVEITYDYIPADVEQDPGTMREILNSDSEGESTYTVVAGDTYSGIAYRHDMSLSELLALNPEADLNKLLPGDALVVKKAIPYLSVQTTERVTYTEPIPCPVETVEDSSMYQGTSKIVTQGIEGESLVTADIFCVNGAEQGRTVISTETLTEPTTTVKAVGTKERPKTMPTGSFQWPIRGRINSYFGYRTIFGSRSYHSGIDIDGSYGATIVASDGGKVTFSGWKSGYGYIVIISHGSGVQTYYAHCSKLLVSAGSEVYKGQAIARVGSTGRSTGNHCHFEIRINGTAVNPLSYLP